MFATLYNFILNFILNLFGFDTRKKKKEIVYFDFETTGLNPYHDKIIEYAFVLETNDKDSEVDTDFGDVNQITSLINPKVKFDKKITNITNIHPDELEDKKTITEKIPSIVSFLNYNSVDYNNTVYLIAHNCDSFDKIFMNQAIKEYEQKNNTNIKTEHWKYLDTLLLAKKLYPNIPSYSLKNLSKKFDVKEGTHRAINDALCLQEIYKMMLKNLSVEIDESYDVLIKNPNIVYNYIYN